MTASLLDMQRSFQQQVLGAAAESVPSAPGMAVYAHAYRARLAEALRTNYPVLHRVVGDAAFDDIAAGYVAAHPSAHRSIRWFGDRLAEYLATCVAQQPHPCLPDLARFEWAVSLAFDGPDATPLGAERLAEVPPQGWADLSLVLHPTLHLLELQWAVEPVWRSLSENPEAAVAPPAALAHPVRIWRQELMPRWRSISALEHRLLRGLAAGASFGELCERLAAEAEGPAHAATQAVTMLRTWLADGLVVGFE